MRASIVLALLMAPAVAGAQEVSEELEDQLRRHPQDVQLRLERAEQLLNLGRFDEALVDCDLAAAVAPQDPSIAFTRGQIRFALGEIDRALADYDTARALSAKRARPPKTFDQLLELIEIEEARALALDALDRPKEAAIARRHAKHLQSLTGVARSRTDT